MLSRNIGLWRFCAALGLATLIIALLILPLFPVDAAGPIPGYGSPVYALEFARTPADLVTVFGAVDDPERLRRMTMMDTGNRWDFLFMTVYALFGMVFGWAARREGAVTGLFILSFAALAGIADAAETTILLMITEGLRGGVAEPTGLSVLYLPVYTKFIALGASIIAAGLYLMKQQQTMVRGLGLALIALGHGTIVATILQEIAAQWLGGLIGAGWLIMLGHALWRSRKATIPPPP